jgi:MoaA/NifB/PqqE/SkfB family radical SAM enzyme
MPAPPFLMQDEYYTDLLNRPIIRNFHTVARILAGNPPLLKYALRSARWQKDAARLSKRRKREGLVVPPVLMVSITHRCNLQCAGCYAHALHQSPEGEMSSEQIRQLVSEAEALGVLFIVLAGVEPLVRRDDILAIAGDHPRIIFPVFTNGLLQDRPFADRIAGMKNIVPVVSLEGSRDSTDCRRGDGVFNGVFQTFSLLRDCGIFFGCSLTATSSNLLQITDDAFIGELIAAGCRLFTFVEYVSVRDGTEELVLGDEERRLLLGRINAFQSGNKALFIGFPGDEDLFGGCLAAGRGFAHIGHEGSLEPCPAAPFSDVNVTRVSLAEALQSDLLAKIRSHREMLTERAGGCALRNDREGLASLLAESVEDTIQN